MSSDTRETANPTETAVWTGGNGQDSVSSGAIISGVGATSVGRLEGENPWSLQVAACRAAVENAGLAPGDIDGLLAEPGYTQPVVDGITPHYLRLGGMLGLSPDLAGAEVLGGASSVAMIQRAAAAIAAGLCTHCLCVYGDAPLSAPGTFERGRGDDATHGLFGAVGIHAMAARHHMDLHGTTDEHLYAVASAARLHAARTTHAQFQEPLDLKTYLASPYVAAPLRKLDCCPVSDCGAAVVVSAEKMCPPANHPSARIAGMGQAHCLAPMIDERHLRKLPAERSGARAFAMAGVTPSDVDFCQLYDCFTIVVLMQLEDYGFCAEGEAGGFVTGGGIAPGGKLPVNTAGGLLAEGYGGGMLHVVEAVRQLRGDAPGRQVEGARLGLVSGHGLGLNTHATLLLEGVEV